MADSIAGYMGSGPGFDMLDIPDFLGRVFGGMTSGSSYPTYAGFGIPESGLQPGDLPGADLAFGDPMTRSLWKQGATGYRAQRLVFPDPTGKLHFWMPAGRPLLFSGDLAAARRVSRVASKAARRVGARRRSGGR